ncbi:type II toxin-antitoxin system HicB family antitoxin [Streptomyces sp. WAC01526]|uniref:type II toxin-antitoxin system HicB family antitoxin n=1 Tax=Streptomyces sp. WAC01526 TaxID=2588709 RepID=UPI0011DF399F|nr:type II toxin-antitoxin system HicB family antitoxin [Streptomyces sp. WAC01526]
MSTHYEARLRRTGRWWAVDIPELAIHTQCRTLDEAEDMARDAIVEALGVRPETVGLTLVVPEVAALLESVLAARRQRAAADAAEEKALADAAHTLSEDLRISQGDACRLLGVSQQEMSRLSRAARSSADARPRLLGPPNGSGMTRPRQHRSAPPPRPGWAVADDA